MTKYSKAIAFVARAGVTAGLYAVLTIVLAPISYGPVQCRISEIMTLFPLFYAEAIPGLIIGCLIANIYSGWWADMVFGTLATAIAALGTYLVGRKIKAKSAPFIGGIFPVIINAVILPLMWLLFSNDTAYWFNFVTVLAGQLVAVYILGLPVFFALKKAKLDQLGYKNIKK